MNWSHELLAASSSFTHGTPGHGIMWRVPPTAPSCWRCSPSRTACAATLQNLLEEGGREIRASTWPQTAPHTCLDHKPWSKVKKKERCMPRRGGYFTGHRMSTVTPGPRVLSHDLGHHLRLSAVWMLWLMAVHQLTMNLTIVLLSAVYFTWWKMFLLGVYFLWVHIQVPIWDHRMTKVDRSETQTCGI